MSERRDVMHHGQLVIRHWWTTCAGCGDYTWCHERKVGGQARVPVCNSCTRSERRWLRQHPNTPHRPLTDRAGAHSVARP